MSGSPELRWEPIVNLQQQQLLLLQLQQQAYFGTSLLTTSSTKAGSSLPRGNSAVNTLSSSGSTGSFNSMSSPTNSLASSGASVGSSSNSGTLKRPSPNPVSALSWAHRKVTTSQPNTRLTTKQIKSAPHSRLPRRPPVHLWGDRRRPGNLAREHCQTAHRRWPSCVRLPSPSITKLILLLGLFFVGWGGLAEITRRRVWAPG